MPAQPLQILIKPAGADCNLACKYCFYSCKGNLYPGERRHRMSDDVLRELVRRYMNHCDQAAAFAWQGGEPTLMGLDFFKRAVEYQKLYGRPGQMVSNSLQTNGVLLDDADWAKFLRNYKWLVGISLDGPADVHDAWRVNHDGQPSHADVRRALDTLLEAEVEVNILTMVTPTNIHRGAELYEYLLSTGVDFLQFIPLCEPLPDRSALADFTIDPVEYGEFLIEIFDLWIAEKPRTAYVRMFDDLLSVVMGNPHPTCMFGPECGQYVVVEHNGDLYACDFFVDEEWKYGNLMEMDFHHIRKLPLWEKFRDRKTAGLDECAACEWFDLCHGGCPKWRPAIMLGEGSRKTYFCEAYKMLFAHAREPLAKLAARLRDEQASRDH